jgi:hypothetical protein
MAEAAREFIAVTFPIQIALITLQICGQNQRFDNSLDPTI